MLTDHILIELKQKYTDAITDCNKDTSLETRQDLVYGNKERS